MQLLKVTRGGRVEHVDLTAVLLLRVDVFNQLIHVLVPQVGVLVLEVGAHGHDDVIGFINVCLKGGSERVSTPRHTHGPWFLLGQLVLGEAPDKLWIRRGGNIQRLKH